MSERIISPDHSVARRALASVSVILLVAFALRISFFWWTQHTNTLVPIHANTPFGYETGEIAAHIASGKGFSSPLRAETGPSAWITPVFPYLLAGIFKIFGVFSYESFLVTGAFDSLVSALTAIPIYFVAKKTSGVLAAAIAGWTWAVFPVSLMMPTEWVWDTCLSAFIAALILWASIEVKLSRNRWHWAAYGLLCAFGVMVNAAILAALPAIWIWLAWPKIRNDVEHRKLIATATLMLLAGCLPWSVRNLIVLHKFIPLRSNFGLELWLGNNPEVPDTWTPWLHPNETGPERDAYIQLGEVNYMLLKRREAMAFIEAHPADVARFTWRRFAENWTGTWEPIADVWKTWGFQARAVVLSTCALSLFGLLGCFILLRQKSPYAWPLLSFPIFFPMVYYFTHPSRRYRHPMDPALVVLSAILFVAPFKKRVASASASSET